MNRSIVLSACALSLAAMFVTASQAQQIDVSLNLRYTDPADPTEGGTWELVAKYDGVGGSGIAAVNALINDIDNGAGLITLNSGIAAIDPICATGSPCDQNNVANNGGTPGDLERDAWITFNGGIGTDLIYGQDMVTIIDGVGTGAGTAGNVATDVLRNSAWDEVALLASGTFSTGTRPTFGTNGLSVTDGNYFDAFATPSATDALLVTNTVRGDSLDTLGLENTAGTGLLAGDALRTGIVNSDDFNVVINSFFVAGGWDDGDFDDTDFVDSDDFNSLINNFFVSSPPPALSAGAVPEPTGLVLVALGTVLLASSRRRFDK